MAEQKAENALADLFKIMLTLAAIIGGIELWHRWRGPSAEDNPSLTAEQVLDRLQRERNITKSKLRTLERTKSATPNLEPHRLRLAAKYQADLSQLDEQISEQEKLIEQLAGTNRSQRF